MLFLGSKKYPNGDDYFQTITENNGHFNAYTDREITNYFFDIHNLSFENALDIFSRFFIDPLFTEEKLKKEINSVNSEYEKNFIIDDRKKSQVFAYIANENDPLNRFTTGNIQSLAKSAEKNGLKLRDELLKFHSKYYTSDKMILIIYTNEQLDDMEEIILEKFSKVKPSQEFLDSIKTDKIFIGAESNKNATSVNSNLKKNFYNAFIQQEKKLSDENIHPIGLYEFKSPFNKDRLGNIVSFESFTQEYELKIIFIQKSMRGHKFFKLKPSLFFTFIIESKEDNSLIDILKKQNLATKLNVGVDKEYNKWSDFKIEIILTKKGIENLNKVLEIISNYLDYMKLNLINKEYFDYLKEIQSLKFEEKNILGNNIYEIVSKMSSRAHHYPISYILHENIFEGNFNKEILEEYARNLVFENSLIFIPSKFFNEEASKFNFLTEAEKKYEPWYKTNFKLYKINFEKLNMENKETKNFSGPVLFEKENVKKILDDTFICDKKCLTRLKSFNTKEPDLLNKTATFELWHKEEFTLDFKKIKMEMVFVYDSYRKFEEKTYLRLYLTHLRKKFKKLNSKMTTLLSTITLSLDNDGINLSFICINQKDIEEKLFNQLSDRILSSLDISKLKYFNQTLHETKDILKKEFNSQPYVLAYDHLKYNILEDHIRIDQEIEIMKSITLDGFKDFILRFKKQLYFKFLFIGSVNEITTRNLFESFNNIVFIPTPVLGKKIYSIKEKRSNKRSILKIDSGNYLIRKMYHGKNNKNNCLLKCFGVDKKNYKSEILIKLFNGIIGNIIFRELRIKRQFGYVAKSKIEIFNNQIVKIKYLINHKLFSFIAFMRKDQLNYLMLWTMQLMRY